MNQRTHPLITLLACIPLAYPAPAQAGCTHAALDDQPFRIFVRDSQTKRGVPLVELTTTNSVTWITDSAGMIAFDEPGLMNTRVHFTVKSPGYQYPADGFGIHGIALDTTPGGSATIDLQRINIAQRLYRVTGTGIYRDSVLLGDTPPITNPLVNGLVNGQDSVQSVIYHDRIFWIWGDTGRPAYPLGNFHASGALSDLPSKGGLEPDVGINLEYFVDRDGFSRGMCPMPDKPGPVWLDGFMVWKDAAGSEHFLTHFVRVKTLGEMYETGIVRYNDHKQVFEPVASFDLDAPLHPAGHPINVNIDDQPTFLFGGPFFNMRVAADEDAITDQSAYEAFTCLKQGAAYDADTPNLDRDANGRLLYSWKPGTPPLNQQQLVEMVNANSIEPGDAWFDVRDVETGKQIYVHGGSVYWNEYRRKWIAILLQSFGEPSFLGEIWYAQADTPMGPWLLARRIVTHDHYSFYNPKQHPFFDRDHGKTIYFEGTYTASFSAAKTQTPRYDYNQIMYKLDLADPRLIMPQPVYHLGATIADPAQYAFGTRIEHDNWWQRIESIAFLAYEPDDAPTGTVPLKIDDHCTVNVWPADDDTMRPGFAKLYRWTSADDPAQTRFDTSPPTAPGNWQRADRHIAWVWPNRMKPAVARAVTANHDNH